MKGEVVPSINFIMSEAKLARPNSIRLGEWVIDLLHVSYARYDHDPCPGSPGGLSGPWDRDGKWYGQSLLDVSKFICAGCGNRVPEEVIFADELHGLKI
jgi:hypothetical protein